VADAVNWTSELALVDRLRKRLPADRARLVVEQADLRRRARLKFADADRLLFTRKGVEQSTDSLVAAHKSERFARFQRVADLCCGIGGDLIETARQTQVLGIELDAIAHVVACANCRALNLSGARIMRQDALHIDVRAVDAWHIDPDRRAAGRRTTSLEAIRPSGAEIHVLLRRNPNGAIKLAPATCVDEDWSRESELQWVGHGRSAQQLVAWFGELARHPGQRVATVLDGNRPRHVIGKPEQPMTPAARVRQYVFEPHAAVLAADLAGALANMLDLEAVIPRGGYLTSDRLVLDPALASFRVIDVVPFRQKDLRSALRSLQAGLVEIKQRGVKLDVAHWQKKLRGTGSRPVSVLATRRGAATIGIIAQRHL
jgi:hypothetical protein